MFLRINVHDLMLSNDNSTIDTYNGVHIYTLVKLLHKN
jgi:hypothetical protein